jgi:poly-gamma-glutamate system protein
MATPPTHSRSIVAAGIISLVAYLLVRVLSPEAEVPTTRDMVDAARLMDRAITVATEHRERSGNPVDVSLDPNRTGLIGPQYSPLFTTVGHLEAKRTTVAPDMAGLIVHLLHEAGVEAGDRVAIGASGSFPALMIASLSAAEAMGARPAIIFSLGASSHGATDVDFHLLDIYQLLQREVGFTVAAEAVSLGGGDDIGEEFDAELRERLIKQIEASGIRFVHEPDLRRNVAERMDFYARRSADLTAGDAASESTGGRAEPEAGAGRADDIAAFINVGGSDANLGTSPLILELKPGLNTGVSLPPERQRGVVFEMASRGIPVIHLLNIRGLTSRYGLPWDPVPLPEPGGVSLFDAQQSDGLRLWLIASGYLLALLGVVCVRRK